MRRDDGVGEATRGAGEMRTSVRLPATTRAWYSNVPVYVNGGPNVTGRNTLGLILDMGGVTDRLRRCS